ncbi:protein JTB-like [Apostichopus japonicus]|uniref:protein JTB-like n=1 Tax=Stichopus japonicus TaxID=307972 RepID=UPI003AB502F8
MATIWYKYTAGILFLIGLLINAGYCVESNNEEGHVEPEAEGDKSDVGPCREVYPCEPCDKLELQIHSSQCSLTGYRRILKCENRKEDMLESCPNGVKAFWIFQLFMIIIGVVFGIMTMFRRRHLDRLVKERIMEQIQNSA